MECEICGEGKAEYLILLEGAKLKVCRECSTSGKILQGPPPKPSLQAKQPVLKEELEIVEGYGKLISQARRRLGLPIEVLAERLNEKASFLERIEHEKTLPDERLCRKLEKELGITLLSSTTETSTASVSNPNTSLTLGDILEIERKKKK
ncbi:MAG: multiprotein-bridging factor 1 family protein [Candidatus Anstonellaceae archaeon]